MYNKGDLKRLVADLRKQGVRVERLGPAYEIYSMDSTLGGVTVKQVTDGVGYSFLEIKERTYSGRIDWMPISWEKLLQLVEEDILVN